MEKLTAWVVANKWLVGIVVVMILVGVFGDTSFIPTDK